MKNKYATCCLLLVCATHALFGQTPEIGIRRSARPPDPPAVSSQQQIDAARLQAVPAEVRSIRESQLQLAREQQVDVNFKDTGRVAQTVIRGVPVALSGITITNEDQLTALVDSLYPLFGFTGTERLIYAGKSGNTHVFREQINGLPVELMTTSIVLGTEQKITSMRGTAVINRNFGTDHLLNEQGAIDTVNRHWGVEGLAPLSDPKSAHAYLLYRYWDDYRTLAPWWYVVTARGNESYVDPEGSVSSAIMVTP